MRFILSAIFVLIATMANAQTFELTAHGFVDSTNINNNYIIVPFEGKNQMEIFNLAMTAIGKNFVSPKDRISKVEYSQINLNGIIPAVTYENWMGKLYYDLNYNLILEFKDRKMKINCPIINDIVRDAPFNAKKHIFLSESERGSFSSISGHKVLFKKNGKVNEKKHVENIEKAMNSLISRIVIEMNNTNNSDW